MPYLVPAKPVKNQKLLHSVHHITLKPCQRFCSNLRILIFKEMFKKLGWIKRKHNIKYFLFEIILKSLNCCKNKRTVSE